VGGDLSKMNRNPKVDGTLIRLQEGSTNPPTKEVRKEKRIQMNGGEWSKQKVWGQRSRDSSTVRKKKQAGNTGKKNIETSMWAH